MTNQNNIVSLFLQSAAKHPQNIALVYKDKQITYAELLCSVQQTAAYFQAKGIKKGDRVLVFVPMSFDLYRSVLALFYIGATAVFLDEWVNKKRMEMCCEIADCKAFIGISKARLFAFFSRPLRKIPVKLGTGYSTKAIQPNCETVSPNDTALITFTTGSTGIPKAAKRTHGFLKEQFNALIDKIEPKAMDIDMPVLPIVLLINLGAGATSVIADTKANNPDPEIVIRQIEQYKVNRLTSSPYFVLQMAKYVLANNIKIDTLTKIFTGGAPVFPNDAAILVKAFPKASIEIVYGSTEAEPISAIQANELLKYADGNALKGLDVGHIYHKTTLKIIKIVDKPISITSANELEELEMNNGEAGEIIVKGDHVLKEYFNNKEAFERNKIVVEDDIWHRTGDAGFFDHDNKLYLLGRCNQIIHTASGTIYPFLCENFFLSIPGISMGTIIHKNHELIICLETLQKGNEKATELTIQLSGLKADRIVYRKQIPRDLRHHSKINYGKLEAMLQ